MGEAVNGGATVRLSDVSVRFGEIGVLERVSLECFPGECLLLTGPTGAGKTTLLRTINGLCQPSEGQVFTLGTWIPGRSRRAAGAAWRQTGTVLQEIALFETKSARGNVELALRAVGVRRAAARRRAVEWLERFGVADKADRYPWRLSGGERQRVALARALAPNPKLLLLDEPTSALDRSTAGLVLDAVCELAEDGATVIISSHREDEAIPMCDRRIEIRAGRVFDGTSRLSPAGDGPREVVERGNGPLAAGGSRAEAGTAGGSGP